jgi:hypothetical protein
MHIIFTSSDSFFANWLKKRKATFLSQLRKTLDLMTTIPIISSGVNPTHFNTLVVGDLPREEAYNYFLHVVENHPYLSKQNKNRLESINFEIPFRMTGGRMFFIQQYVNQVHISGYFEDRKFEAHIMFKFYIFLATLKIVSLKRTLCSNLTITRSL